MRRCQRPANGIATSRTEPIAVGAEHRLALERLDAALRQAQRQGRFPGRQRAALAVHQLQHKMSTPTLPGETSTWNIAVSVWIWIASGVTAAAASARGGGVKRQPATTARIAITMTHSARIDRSSGRVLSGSRASAGVSRKRFSAASPSSAATSASLIEQDDAVLAVDQRAEALELDDGQREPGQHQQATTDIAACENRFRTGSRRLRSAATPSPPAAPARRPRRRRRRRAGTRPAAVSHCGDAVAACPLEASDRPTPASANADSIRGDARDPASQRNDAGDHRRRRDQQGLKQAGCRGAPSTAPPSGGCRRQIQQIEALKPERRHRADQAEPPGRR